MIEAMLPRKKDPSLECLKFEGCLYKFNVQQPLSCLDRLSFEALQCVRETWVCGLKSLSLVCEDSEKIQKSFVKVLHDHLLHEALPDVEAVGHLFDVALELASALQIQFVHLLPQASDFSRSRCVSRVRVAFLLAWERFGPNLHFSSTLESDKDNAETKEASGKLTSNEAALVFVGQFLQRSFLDCAEHDTSIGKEGGRGLS